MSIHEIITPIKLFFNVANGNQQIKPLTFTQPRNSLMSTHSPRGQTVQNIFITMCWLILTLNIHHGNGKMNTMCKNRNACKIFRTNSYCFLKINIYMRNSHNDIIKFTWLDTYTPYERKETVDLINFHKVVLNHVYLYLYPQSKSIWKLLLTLSCCFTQLNF